MILANSNNGELDTPVGEIADSASSLWASFLDAVPRVGVAIVVICVGWLLARGVRRALHRVLQRNQSPSFARVMSKIVGWAIVAAASLVAVATTFPSVKPVDLLAGLGFFSVAVGFAFQDILENTLAGVLLLFRQPFQSGDQIEVEGRTGTVEAITIRETRLQTFDGQLVVIPNRDVYKSSIRVQTHYDARRLSFVVGIAYENDAAQACDIVTEALRSLDGVASTPAPEALVTELGVSTVNLDARFWCTPRQHEARVLLDRAIKAVKAALDDAGIEMPADIIAIQATPSLKAALHAEADLTPGGSVVDDGPTGVASTRLGGDAERGADGPKRQ